MNRRERRAEEARQRTAAKTSGADQTSFEDFFLGKKLAAGRACGECVACCEVLTIDTPDLKKPADTLCAHCTGTGCGIYETRPEVCRDWYCVWRRIGAMPESTRPDRLGVMFELCTPNPVQNLLMRRYIRAFSLAGPENFNAPDVLRCIDMFKQAPVPVWLFRGATSECVHPSKEVQHVLLLGATPSSAEVAREADLYRRLYASD